jgi:mono/diheme cytochrome c family protein
MNKRTFTMFAVAAMVGASVVTLPGQQTRAAQVFTVEQATAGKGAYARSCASCHMPDLSGSNEMPALAGTAFIGTWGGRSTKELFEYMKTSMPYGLPSLSTEAYESITAYILEANGAVAGSQPLRGSTAVQIASVTDTRTRHSGERSK